MKHEKKDAGVASVKKLPTARIVEQIPEILRTLDVQVHMVKLEANNKAWTTGWPGLDGVIATARNLAAHTEELRVRAKRGW